MVVLKHRWVFYRVCAYVEMFCQKSPKTNVSVFLNRKSLLRNEGVFN